MDDPSPRTAAECRAFDRHAIDVLGVPGIVLMENAGLRAADRVAQLVDEREGAVAILCGSGGNGGDGYVVGRQLAARGISVQLFHAKPAADMRGDAAVQRGIVDRMGLPGRALEDLDLAGCAVCVDALLGTGFLGPLREDLYAAIEALTDARERGIPLVALDVPSGLDADTGEPQPVAVRADLTLTFGASKVGFDTPGAASFTGAVEVLSLGVPAL